ncbi:MAG: rRNA maturation RNase YbeY [Chloroflexota bacterium]|nr:rRNA maturation RNase YbeY [Chloroflexota bacterium]
MITIQRSRDKFPRVNETLIEMAVKNTLAYFEKPFVDITIQLTDDDEITELNRVFLDEAKTTDVLAFNQDFTDPETNKYYLGDIIISIERAAAQAPKYNLTLDQECAYLAIHGTLHLMGYDHYEASEKDEMWKIQDKIFHETIEGFQEKS